MCNINYIVSFKSMHFLMNVRPSEPSAHLLLIVTLPSAWEKFNGWELCWNKYLVKPILLNKLLSLLMTTGIKDETLNDFAHQWNTVAKHIKNVKKQCISKWFWFQFKQWSLRFMISDLPRSINSPLHPSNIRLHLLLVNKMLSTEMTVFAK